MGQGQYHGSWRSVSRPRAICALATDEGRRYAVNLQVAWADALKMVQTIRAASRSDQKHVKGIEALPPVELLP